MLEYYMGSRRVPKQMSTRGGCRGHVLLRGRGHEASYFTVDQVLKLLEEIEIPHN